MEDFIFQIIWEEIGSNSYLIVDRGSAVVIDPVDDDRIDDILQKYEINNLKILLTHEHFDHISGLNRLCGTYSCEVYASKVCSKKIQNSKENLSAFANIVCFFNDRMKKTGINIKEFSCQPANFVFENEYRFHWMEHSFYLKSTPGHSPGSICILLDHKYLFTGDSLLADYEVITRLPGGSMKQYGECVMPFIRSLSENIWVFPGHGKTDILGNILKENSLKRNCKRDL